MKTILLGGGGFFGSHISEALIQAGHEITIFDLPNARFLDYSRNLGAKIITGDFNTNTDLKKILQDHEIIINLIYNTLPQSSNDNPQLDVMTNVVGFLKLLDIIHHMPGKRIIYPSSGGTVYGVAQEVPIKENHPTNPICSYGITKMTIEKYIQLYRTLHKLDYCILRIANAYGERQPTKGTQGIIGVFMEKVINNEEISIWGDGTIIRDYIHISDVAQAFVKAVEYNGEPRLFNIGSGKGHSINEITDTLFDLTQKPMKVKYMPSRKFDVPNNVLDISLAKTYLGWEPRIGLKEGMKLTLQARESQSD